MSRGSVAKPEESYRGQGLRNLTKFEKIINFLLTNDIKCDIIKKTKREVIKMSTVVKNRNFLEITTDEDKLYKYNINTAELIGVRGKPIKTTNSMIVYAIRHNSSVCNVAQYLSYRSRLSANDIIGCNVRVIAVLDRLDGIGYSFASRGSGIPMDSYLCQLADCFTDFHKAFKENNNIGIYSFLQEHKITLFAKEHNLIVDEHFTKEMLDFLYDAYDRHAIPKKYIHLTANFLARGAYKYHQESSLPHLMDRLDEYYKWCALLEIEPQKGIFMYEYCKIKANYEAAKTELDIKILSKYQLLHQKALTFESEELIVIIPTTEEQFKQEGKAQDNCVYSSYYRSVYDGNTNVVFIRHKSNPDVSYITCEVYNGRIIQYLTAHNCRPKENYAEKFKMDYQEHLNKYWAE